MSASQFAESMRLTIMSWLELVGIAGAVVLVIAFLLSIARYGGSGFEVFVRGLVGYFRDLITISPRRVLANAGLTFREAIRRRALLIFVFFAVLLMFAGWFVSDSNAREELQVGVHVTLVLTSMAWLTLLAMMFLACWGLPEDIRLRSLHTVVTKPVRRVEIVVGRMLGFIGIGSVILAVMAVAGYVWIQRQVPDSAKNLLTCRVPIYGELYFLDRGGQPVRKGINVGDIYDYRSYVEGNSRSRAIFDFYGLTSDDIGDALQMESRFEAFRTVKGTTESMQSGMLAQFTVTQNPREEVFGLLSTAAIFRPIADSLRDGNFRNAASELRSVADRLELNPDELVTADYMRLSVSYGASADRMGYVREDELFDDVKQAIGEVGLAAARYTQARTDFEASPEVAASAPPNDELVAAFRDLADVFDERSEALFSDMPRLEVALAPFNVQEYRDGDNQHTIPREITFTPDDEVLARHLTDLVDRAGQDGALLNGQSIVEDFADRMSQAEDITFANADLLRAVLQEELDAGRLGVQEGNLLPADGSGMLRFLFDLIRQERLASQELEGWQLTADLFDDLTVNGALRVEVSCLDNQMYLGMAREDLFIRLADRSFFVGYSKAVFSTGLMLAVVVGIGVAVSCLVKGPVAFFFTMGTFVVGQFFHRLLRAILSDQMEGAGTLESAMLIFQHRNPNVGLDANETTKTIVSSVDTAFGSVLHIADFIVPNFNTFTNASMYVEKGFDVSWYGQMVPALLTAAGFLIPCVLIGTVFLKFRELESK